MADQHRPVILLVNDDEIGRYALRRTLEQNGFEVLEAATGMEGLAKASAQPDLILLDVNLPDLIGYDVSSKLKANAATRHIPVLHISATFQDAGSQVRGLESGADGYLTYPIEAPVLIATIRAHLRIREVEAQRSELALLLEDVSDGIVVMDADARILTWNQGAQAIYGWTAHQVLGKSYAQLVAADGTEAIDFEELKSLRRWQGECRQQHCDGHVLDTFVSLTFVERGARQSPKFVAVVRDITRVKWEERERERLLTELKELNQSLERRVDERTSELTEANILLRSQTNELESLVYAISHDLRSPLRGVNGFSYVLLEEYAEHLDERGQEYLRRISKGAQLMGELLDRMVKLSQLANKSFTREEVELSELASQIIAERHRMDETLSVAFEVQPGLTANGDASLLRIMLNHLLDNAIRFSCSRSQPRVQFGSENQDGEQVYFVRDNGIGFDMKYGSRLFTAFQGLHTDSGLTGDGVGLAVVRRIVQRHGGRVWAQAAPEEGATFYFTLSSTPAAGDHHSSLGSYSEK